MLRVQFNNFKAMYPANFKSILTGIVAYRKESPKKHNHFKVHGLNGGYVFKQLGM